MPRQRTMTDTTDTVKNVSLTMPEPSDKIMLRGRPTDTKLITAIESLTGCKLPIEPRSSSVNADIHVLSLSPDRWLILIEPYRATKLADSLHAELRQCHVAIADVSDAFVDICVHGSRAKEVLMRCATLDFSINAFKPGMIVSASFIDTNAIYYLAASDPHCFNLYIPRSYANYVHTWLKQTISSM